MMRNKYFIEIGEFMSRIIRFNYVLTTLIAFVIINLSCDKEGVTPYEQPEDNYDYVLTVDIDVEGGDIDYSDYNNSDSTVIVLTLFQTPDYST